jgi:hypothetical protein
MGDFQTSQGRRDAERRHEPVREVNDGRGVRSAHDSRAAASVEPPPTRFTRRSAGGRAAEDFPTLPAGGRHAKRD